MRTFLITHVILTTQNTDPESSSGYFSGIHFFLMQILKKLYPSISSLMQY